MMMSGVRFLAILNRNWLITRIIFYTRANNSLLSRLTTTTLTRCSVGKLWPWFKEIDEEKDENGSKFHFQVFLSFTNRSSMWHSSYRCEYRFTTPVMCHSSSYNSWTPNPTTSASSILHFLFAGRLLNPETPSLLLSSQFLPSEPIGGPSGSSWTGVALSSLHPRCVRGLRIKIDHLSKGREFSFFRHHHWSFDEESTIQHKYKDAEKDKIIQGVLLE